MLGSKSISTVLLLAIVGSLAWSQGVLSPAYLFRLDPWMASLLGLFSCLTAGLFFRLWGLNERSSSGLRLRSRDSLFETQVTLVDHLGGRITVGGSTEEPPVDFPPVLQRIIVILVFLLVGFMAFNNRTFGLFQDLPDRFRLGETRFCDEVEGQEETKGPEAQGCELVRRAHRLGYADDLGPCEPKAEEREQGPCKLRQRDEPYLHYAWRLLVERTTPVLDDLSLSAFEEFRAELGNQWEHFDALLRTQAQSITSMPRSSHHLWTNLPHPRPGVLGHLLEAVEPGHCLAQTTQASDRWTMSKDAPTASELFERVFGELFFDPRYKPIVGVCGEYTIHWDAPKDACDRLARNPTVFLVESNALAPVLQVLGRMDRERELAGLKLNLATLAQARKDGPGSERIVSFQCLTVDPETFAGSREYTFSLNGLDFRATDARIAQLPQGRRRPMELARLLASLLARSFFYGRLASQESLSAGDEDISFDDLFAGDDFLLAKLEYLRDADPFVAHERIQKRTDLYEVVPYHLHVRGFIEVFRRHYRLQRGRL